MAQKTVVSLIDDLDGGEADESVSFGLDGKAYEIDLSAANAQRLRDCLADFVASARRATERGEGTRTRTRTRSRSNGSGGNASAVRAWAHEQGLPVNERGRVPRPLVEQYEAAQRTTQPAG